MADRIYIPTFISSVDFQPARVLPHIYFFNGLKECEPYYIQHYTDDTKTAVTSSVQQSFPYFDYYDGLVPSTTSNSLLFFNEQPAYGVTPSASLYTQYWDTYVSLLYDPKTRLIDASAIIPLADYFGMELNDIVEWRGNYYHLRAINDYNLVNGTCKLQLLGPIIRDSVTADLLDCDFDFSSSLEVIVPTTTIAPTTTIPPTTLAPYSVDYLIIAGGGGGGDESGGGGGAGGYISGSTSVTPSTGYSLVVGAGGAVQTSGNDSSAFTLTADGGGYGGSTLDDDGAVGGSGGGAGKGNTSNVYVSGSEGISPTGNKGGSSIYVTGKMTAGGGGGGKGTIGQSAYPYTNPNDNPDTTSYAGNGGSGSLWLDGNTYAGGGGGWYSGAVSGTGTGGNTRIGEGGSGGGGNGGWDAISAATAGTANTGGGGGGGKTPTYIAAAGGSGVVIVRYAGTPRGTGGTITESGGFTYHTFNSSGTFTA